MSLLDEALAQVSITERAPLATNEEYHEAFADFDAMSTVDPSRLALLLHQSHGVAAGIPLAVLDHVFCRFLFPPSPSDTNALANPGHSVSTARAHPTQTTPQAHPSHPQHEDHRQQHEWSSAGGSDEGRKTPVVVLPWVAEGDVRALLCRRELTVIDGVMARIVALFAPFLRRRSAPPIAVDVEDDATLSEVIRGFLLQASHDNPIMNSASPIVNASRRQLASDVGVNQEAGSSSPDAGGRMVKGDSVKGSPTGPPRRNRYVQLPRLSLRCDERVATFRPVSQLRTVTSLDCSFTEISAADLEHLMTRLPWLETLSLCGCARIQTFGCFTARADLIASQQQETMNGMQRKGEVEIGGLPSLPQQSGHSVLVAPEQMASRGGGKVERSTYDCPSDVVVIDMREAPSCDESPRELRPVTTGGSADGHAVDEAVTCEDSIALDEIGISMTLEADSDEMVVQPCTGPGGAHNASATPASGVFGAAGTQSNMSIRSPQDGGDGFNSPIMAGAVTGIDASDAALVKGVGAASPGRRPVMRHLTSVDLSCTEVTEVDLPLICAALPEVHRLDLRSCNVIAGADGAAFESIAECRALTDLNVMNVPAIGPKAFAAIAECPSLTSLAVSTPHLQPKAVVKALGETVGHMPGLVRLDLTGSHISAAAAAAALPYVKVLTV